MKTIIAGGRNYCLTPADLLALEKLPITEVVSGGATGADAVVLFPGDRGTASMRREAQRAGISIFDFTVVRGIDVY